MRGLRCKPRKGNDMSMRKLKHKTLLRMYLGRDGIEQRAYTLRTLNENQLSGRTVFVGGKYVIVSHQEE